MKKMEINITTGNGASGAKRSVQVQLTRGPQISYEECNRVATFEIDGKIGTRIPGHNPLTVMIDRFVWDVEAGRINPYFVELSAAVTRSLEAIRLKAST